MNSRARLFSSLSRTEKDQLRLKVMILCPEIFGQGTKKYERVPLAMLELGGCVSSNVRDVFSAGGQTKVSDDVGREHIIRGIDAKLLALTPLFPQVFQELDEDVFRLYWGEFHEDCAKRLERFLNMLDQESAGSLLDIRLSRLLREMPILGEVCHGR